VISDQAPHALFEDFHWLSDSHFHDRPDFSHRVGRIRCGWYFGLRGRLRIGIRDALRLANKATKLWVKWQIMVH
jgi:hypothetical protein